MLFDATTVKKKQQAAATREVSIDWYIESKEIQYADCYKIVMHYNINIAKGPNACF